MRREPGGETHLALESYDGLAARKRSHCGSWYLGHTRHAEGIAHGFGVNAFETSVPPHLVQRWLGHASLKTTAIYGDVIGPEERKFAARMWSEELNSARRIHS
jgi:integrase